MDMGHGDIAILRYQDGAVVCSAKGMLIKRYLAISGSEMSSTILPRTFPI
jgi:hypothetical protein